ncbi:MAG TPA: hypothetical protein RMH99_29340 [Sandaracinaceae bacterium LLY-WYZ-13_1]|nr:hypothetical protein [Sandaracinaceae bacterium LLY-WYZ-13_1]
MSDRRYTPDHLWIDGDGRVGVTPAVLARLPSVEAVHLPAPGTRVHVARAFGALELAKGCFDLHAPCDGVVVEARAVRPWELNGDRWLVRVDGTRGRLWTLEEYLARATKPRRR